MIQYRPPEPVCLVQGKRPRLTSAAPSSHCGSPGRVCIIRPGHPITLLLCTPSGSSISGSDIQKDPGLGGRGAVGFHQVNLQAAGWGRDAEADSEQEELHQILTFSLLYEKFIISCHLSKICPKLVTYCAVIISHLTKLCHCEQIWQKNYNNLEINIYINRWSTAWTWQCIVAGLWQWENKCVNYTFYGGSPKRLMILIWKGARASFRIHFPI